MLYLRYAAVIVIAALGICLVAMPILLYLSITTGLNLFLLGSEQALGSLSQMLANESPLYGIGLALLGGLTDALPIGTLGLGAELFRMGAPAALDAYALAEMLAATLIMLCMVRMEMDALTLIMGVTHWSPRATPWMRIALDVVDCAVLVAAYLLCDGVLAAIRGGEGRWALLIALTLACGLLLFGIRTLSRSYSYFRAVNLPQTVCSGLLASLSTFYVVYFIGVFFQSARASNPLLTGAGLIGLAGSGYIVCEEGSLGVRIGLTAVVSLLAALVPAIPIGP